MWFRSPQDLLSTQKALRTQHITIKRGEKATNIIFKLLHTRKKLENVGGFL